MSNTTAALSLQTAPGKDGAILRIGLVVGNFLLLLYGLTTLAATVDFFGALTLPDADLVRFLTDNAGTLQPALVAALLGYLLTVPVMVMVTDAYPAKERSPNRLAYGLIWASLALRPLWWAAHLVLLPQVTAISDVTAPAAQAFLTSFRMVDLVLNTATEDVAINLMGGVWFVLIGGSILRHGGSRIAVGATGILVGAMYILSSAELVGLSLGDTGRAIPMIASVSGPFWLLFTGLAVAWRSR